MSPVKGLDKRVAIVTGGASGIGLATARRFVAAGARVVIIDIDGEKARNAVQDLEAVGPYVPCSLECDVANENQVQQTVSTVIDRFRSVDIIVNSAGSMVFKSLEQQTHEDWLGVLGANLLGAVFFTKQAFLRMRSGGCIVNVASVHAIRTTALVSSYAASKAAMLSLTRSGAIEGKAKGIRVNAVIPGAIETPMLHQNPNIKSGAEALCPTDVGQPDDVAAAISYLVSEEAAFINGAEILVDGGRMSRL